MGAFLEAGKADDFSEGKPEKVIVGGQEILLAKVADKFYAVSNRCLHLGGDLSRGNLEGTVITCPRHASQFDITDGSVVRWLKGSGLLSSIVRTVKQSKMLNSYNVKVDDNTVFIEV